MPITNNKIEGTFTLFDDESTREKHTVMSKWEVVVDDSRNSGIIHDDDIMENFLQFGRKYKITIEEI